MNRKTIAFWVLLVMVFAVPVFPFMVELGLDELVSNAELVTTGRVVEKECMWGENGKLIYTYVAIAVDEYVKGEGEVEVIVRHLGGEVGGKGLIVGNMPSFREGEEVLVFLRGTGQVLLLQAKQALPLQVPVYEVSGLVQGKYEVFVNEMGEKLIKNDSLYQIVSAQGIADKKVLSAISLSEFVSEIRELIPPY